MSQSQTSSLSFPPQRRWLKVCGLTSIFLCHWLHFHEVRSAILSEKQEAAQTAALQKQAMRAEADAFRGVHLDPNAHHWDEVSLLRAMRMICV